MILPEVIVWSENGHDFLLGDVDNVIEGYQERPLPDTHHVATSITARKAPGSHDLGLDWFKCGERTFFELNEVLAIRAGSFGKDQQRSSFTLLNLLLPLLNYVKDLAARLLVSAIEVHRADRGSNRTNGRNILNRILCDETGHGAGKKKC